MEKNAFHATRHQYQTYETRAIENAISDGRISKREAGYIREFLSETNSQKDLSAQRKFKLASNLCTVSQYTPDIDEMTIGDLYEAVEKIKNGISSRGKPYTRNTQSDLLRILKRFTVWLIENGYSDLNLKKVQKIKIPAYSTKTKSDKDILTEEEILKIIATAKSIRYRALLSVLFEGGFRIQECADMRWQDVRFTDWGARIRTDGKTEKERAVPIIMYCDTLAKWQSEHPDPSPENYVFLNLHNKPLKYQNTLKTIKQFAEEAGIERKITPHIFRHSRITFCLRNGMQETLLKKTFWGNETTDMLKIYSHLTPGDADEAFARMAGVELPEDAGEESKLKPVQCDQCHYVNAPGARFCSRCGKGLSEEARATVEGVKAELRDIMAEDPVTLLEAAREIEAMKAGRHGGAVQAPEQARPPADGTDYTA